MTKAVGSCAVFLGAVGALELVWDVADTLNGLMAAPNLIALVLLKATGALLVVVLPQLGLHTMVLAYHLFALLAFFVQGATIERFVARMCEAGKSVAYEVYPGVNHFQTRQHGFVDSLQWMQDVLDGNAPTSSCSRFASQK